MTEYWSYLVQDSDLDRVDLPGVRFITTLPLDKHSDQHVVLVPCTEQTAAWLYLQLTSLD